LVFFPGLLQILGVSLFGVGFFFLARSLVHGIRRETQYSRALSESSMRVEQLEVENETLQARAHECNLMVRERDESFQKVESLREGMERIIALTSHMSLAVQEDNDGFLKELLEMLMVLVPKADYGSISLVEGAQWRYVHAIGHNIEKLKELALDASLLFPIESVSLVEDILRKDREFLPEDTHEKLTQATLPVNYSLLSRLKIGHETVGNVSLDIASESDKNFDSNDIRILESFSNVASAFLAMQKYSIKQGRFQKELIMSMIRMLELHDPYTKGHSENVAQLSAQVAEELGWSKERVARVYWSGLVHDVGKILVPGAILTKTGRLTAEEFQIIRMHPVWGAQVLDTSTDLKDIANYVRFHHERWDGRGYPEGMAGPEVPMISRVLAIADCFDAMTSDRPYRKGVAPNDALSELQKEAGKQFDPKFVEVFTKIQRRYT